MEDDKTVNMEEIRQRRLNRFNSNTLSTQVSQEAAPSSPSGSGGDQATSTSTTQQQQQQPIEIKTPDKVSEKQPVSASNTPMKKLNDFDALSLSNKKTTTTTTTATNDRTESMDVDQLNSKRKLNNIDLHSKRNESTTAASENASLNPINVIERIFLINLTSNNNKSDIITSARSSETYTPISVPDYCLNVELNYKELVNEILFETVRIFMDESDERAAIKNKTRSWDLINLNMNHSRYSKDTPELLAVKYLIDSYNRILNYSSQNYRLFSNQNSNESNGVTSINNLIINLINESKFQIIQFTILLLTNAYSVDIKWSPLSSFLTPFLLSQYVPHEFLTQLISESKTSNAKSLININTDEIPFDANDQTTLAYIFGPILNEIVLEIKSSSAFSSFDYAKFYGLLKQLCDIKIDNTRPICNLMVKMSNWLPMIDESQQNNNEIVNGKVLSETSLLGPLFRFSAFAEDEPSVAEKFFLNIPPTELTNKTISLVAQQIRPTLTLPRSELIAMTQALMFNAPSRKPVLTFMEHVLRVNAKRANIQSDESVLSSDGFMINILYVLQELARPIKKEKIEIMTIYDPANSSKIVALKDDEARLNCSKDKLVEWLSSLSSNADHYFRESNFSTDAFFLTLVAHNLSVISIIRKYLQRLRVIKELNRVIEELKQTEPIWKQTYLAERNRTLMEKWQVKLKVGEIIYI